jgi:rubrerythrin
MNAKQFVKQLGIDNKALFEASRMQVNTYFANQPSQEELIEHFTGRMVNERMNMVAISEQIANMPANADTTELRMLTKQAFDEANHFEMVKEVIEHIAGKKIDVAKAIAHEAANPTAKGASLLEKYEASTDEVALALYQFIAEGRAEVVWEEMSNCIEDKFISTRYAKIAKDEGFHSKIGRAKLEQLCASEEVQAKVTKLAHDIRCDLFRISAANTTPVAEAKELVKEAYGLTV